MIHKASREDILFHTLLPVRRKPGLNKGPKGRKMLVAMESPSGKGACVLHQQGRNHSINTDHKLGLG